jgi:hypothetical protein
VLKKLVDHVQPHTLNGFLGHQKEKDLGTQFPTPVSHWIGSTWKDGKAYFRGVIDPTATDLKRWIRAGRVTQPSIFTTPTLSKRGGETHVTALEPISIDWAPLHRAGMQSASVVGWAGEMRPLGDDDVLPPPAPAPRGRLAGATPRPGGRSQALRGRGADPGRPLQARTAGAALMGRPSKRTPQLEEELLRALRLGNTRTASCQYVGIPLERLERWQRSFVGFRRAVEAAEAAAEVRVVGRLINAVGEGDIAAIKFWLERRRPEHWAPPRAKIEGDISIDLPDLLKRAWAAHKGDFAEPEPSPVVSIPDLLNARNGTTEH